MISQNITSLSIPHVHLMTRDSVFSPKYAVIPPQVYEVHYSCSTDSPPQAIRRRYSEFHKFHSLIKHKDRLRLVAPFPKKKWIRSWTPQVVEERRRGLEVWLGEVAERTGLRTYLLDFLGAAPIVEERLTNTPTPGEQTITQTLTRLVAQPHMRLATLEAFEKEFFELKGPVNADYILAFVQKIVPLCGDNYVGCKSISILANLASREKYRWYLDVVRSLRQLPLPSLREMHLEKHLLRAMGEESFQLTRLVGQEDDTKIDQLVSCN